MFKRRYLVALTVGSLIGIVALATAAEFCYNAIHPTGWMSQWEIPGWDINQDFTPGPMRDLKHRALVLRMGSIFIEHGFAYFLVPIVLALGIAKVDQLGAANRKLYCLSKSVAITACGVCVVAIPWAISASLHDTGVPKLLEGQVLYAYHAFLFLVGIATFSGLVPSFWMFIYVVLWRKTRPKPAK